jgi:hypothetical protein
MAGQTKVQPMAEQIAIQPMVKKHCTVQINERPVTVKEGRQGGGKRIIYRIRGLIKNI